MMATQFYSPDMEYLIKKAVELGAENAKIIATDTVAVGEWVRWKCLYGCPLYGKDASHPPLAPDAQSTRQVLGEYEKGLLLHGSKGKVLSDVAVRLEGEAYQMGYYKAFAFTSLSSSPAST